MSREPGGRRHTVEARTVSGRPVRIITAHKKNADAISDAISQGARVLNPVGEIVSAFAPAALLALGTAGARTAATAELPTVEIPPFIVYSPGAARGGAAEVRRFAPEWGDRARDIESVGSVVADYQLLKKAFGEPILGSQIWEDDKTQVLWLIEFGDGEWATVYDYQTFMAPEENDYWRVGAWDPAVVAYVQGALREAGGNAAALADEFEDGPTTALVVTNPQAVGQLKRRLLQ